jgi:hypothetical protein
MTGAFQDPTGSSRTNVLYARIILEIIGELVGESLCLFSVEKPVRAHEALPEETFPVKADHPGVAGALDLLDRDGEIVAGGNCHRNFRYLGEELQ